MGKLPPLKAPHPKRSIEFKPNQINGRTFLLMEDRPEKGLIVTPPVVGAW